MENKNVKIFILIIGLLILGTIGTVLLQSNRFPFLDTEYLFGWGRFKPFPEEIRQKHATTIEKVDALIIKENGVGEVTSRSEKFNLENYLGIIRVGVLTYLNNKDPNDPFMKDVEFLAEDIDRYLMEKGRKNYYN